MQRVTLKEIASACDYSLMTVSYALRNHPKIPLLTREKIQAVARQLGYVPDPMLNALVGYREGLKRPDYRNTLGFVSNWSQPARQAWAHFAPLLAYFDGAKERASEMGYELEEFWLKERGMNPRRLSNILRSRGIRGLIIGPMLASRSRLDLAWEHFSAVALDRSLVKPMLDHVTSNNASAIELVWHQLLHAKVKRVGLIQMRNGNERAGYYFQSFHELWQRRYQNLVHEVPTLILPDDLNSRQEEETILRWYELHRPEVLLGFNMTYIALLERAGYRLHKDFRFIHLDLHPSDLPLSGIQQHPHKIGATAVEQLHLLLQKNAYGLPKLPQSTLVGVNWESGQTF